MEPSTRFLLAGLSAAASTQNAIRPASLTGRASMPAFAFGLTPSELPLHTGAFQLAAAALLARSGGLRGWRGALGAAAFAGSLAGLATLHRNALGAGAVLEAAIVDELGSDYRSRIREPFTPRDEVPITRQQLLMS